MPRFLQQLDGQTTIAGTESCCRTESWGAVITKAPQLFFLDSSYAPTKERHHFDRGA